MIAVLIAGGAAWRLRQVDRERRAMLTGTVSAEALALRLSDRDGFMRRQGPAEDWRDRQRASFDAFQQYGKEVTVTDQILGVELSEDDARVRIQVMVGNHPDEAVWIYRYTADRGWRHVGTEYEPWSEQEQAAEWFTILHYPADEAWANSLEALLTSWWTDAAQASDVLPPHLKIQIDPEARQIHWSRPDADMLVVPSYRLGDAPPDPASDRMIIALADVMAEHWAIHATGREVFNGYDGWVLDEVSLWYRRQFDPSSPAPRILAPLIHAFGPDLMPIFLREMREGTRVGTTAMRRAMQVSAPQSLSGRELEQYLSSYLYAEATFVQAETGRSFEPDWRATTIFFDPERLARITPQVHDDSWIMGVPPYSIQVLDTELHRGILWARTQILLDRQWWERFPSDYQPAILYVPFRKVNGAWMHTRPRIEDWGESIREDGDLLGMVYYELDAPYAGGLQSYLEAVYRHAAADMGLDEPPPAVFTVYRELLAPGRGVDPGALYLGIVSPHAACCLPLDGEAGFRDSAALSVVDGIFYWQAGITRRRASEAIPRALLAHEYDILGISSPTDLPPVPVRSRRVDVPETFEDLWRASVAYGDLPSRWRAQAADLGARLLLELILERYGDAAYPQLVDTLGEAQSMPHWLALSLGLDEDAVASLEAEWHARYMDSLAAMGYLIDE